MGLSLRMSPREGDIIRTIKANMPYIGHFHTAGNPGRNELDESQELYYPAIMRTIANSDYDGYVGQEFRPKSDPLVVTCLQFSGAYQRATR